MIVAGSASPLLLSSAGGYNLTNSLRFRASASAYLNRTFSAGTSNTTFTWSGWVKRGTLGSSRQTLFASGNTTGVTILSFSNGTDDTLDCALGDGTSTFSLITTQVFRDPSAWYHVVWSVDTTQATNTNRNKLYINGVQVTAFGTATYPAQNANVQLSSNNNSIGRLQVGTQFYFDGYLSEVNFIDGQALTPSSFGQTSATTGVWIPKKYTGTYGTNGFYLPFTDNSALTTSSNVGLGKDFSGNSNYWTTNNISITSGSTYDSMTDVPTLTDINTANYCVFSPIVPASQTNSEANLKVSTASTAATAGTILPSSGKWYAEIALVSGTFHRVGVCNSAGIAQDLGGSANGWCYLSDARVFNNGSTSSYGVTSTNGDIINVALDLDNGRVWYGKNGTWMASGDPATNSNPSQTFTANQLMTFAVASGSGTIVYTGNFGQRPFAYTPPTGFNRLNTFNLPTPTIGATASTQANDYFDATLYTGNGSTQSITNSGSMQPDFLWIKRRDAAASHAFIDSVRGISNQLASNNTNAEVTGCTDGITSLNSNGFSLGAGTIGYITNTNGATLVAWQWKANGSGSTNTAGSITSTVSANTTAGFSIVTYTGTGSTGTIGHGLGVAPSMVIIKSRTTGSSSWIVYHSSISPTNLLTLQTTDAQQNLPLYFNSTATASTVFSIGSAANTGIDLNVNGSNYVAYCFAQVAGYSAFGSYTGNGSTDGPFIYTGFRPKYILIKRTDTTASWYVYDTVRQNYNAMGAQTDPLLPNSSSAEGGPDASWYIDALSNGFKIRNASNFDNNSSGTYIYACFAESPFKYANAR